MVDVTLSLGAADRVEALPRFAAGTSISRFRIVGELVAGGMGVFEAYDPELDRGVAIKVLGDPDASHKLLEEAQAMARLHGVIEGQLAVCLNDLGRYDDAYTAAAKAVAELERAGASPEQCAVSWMTLADLEARRGHRARAIELARHLLATTSDGETATLAEIRAHETARLAEWAR